MIDYLVIACSCQSLHKHCGKLSNLTSCKIFIDTQLYFTLMYLVLKQTVKQQLKKAYDTEPNTKAK